MTGIDIKYELEKKSLTQTWLMNQLERAGQPVDYTRLSHILNGRIKTENSRDVIETSDRIIKIYDKTFGRAAI